MKWLHSAYYIRTLKISMLLGLNTAAYSADLGAASSSLLNQPKASQPGLETEERIERLRINVLLQGWNSLPSKSSAENAMTAKIPTKPLSHVLRARMEKPNDFYLGDWRIQSSPIRWIKSTGQYQAKLELFRRIGDGGQVEESIGTMHLSGVVKKQSDGIYAIQGSSKRRFLDGLGQPILEVTAGTPALAKEEPIAVSKAPSNTQVK